MNQKILYVIRGLPGSGKSSLAASLDLSCPAFEADTYFLNETGEYVFNQSNLGAAHRWCEEQVATAMRADWPRLAVANTSVVRRDYEEYLSLAAKYGYSVFVVHCENTWVNTHGCPAEKVQQMAGRWKPHDPRFKAVEFLELIRMPTELESVGLEKKVHSLMSTHKGPHSVHN